MPMGSSATSAPPARISSGSRTAIASRMRTGGACWGMGARSRSSSCVRSGRTTDSGAVFPSATLSSVAPTAHRGQPPTTTQTPAAGLMHELGHASGLPHIDTLNESTALSTGSRLQGQPDVQHRAEDRHAAALFLADYPSEDVAACHLLLAPSVRAALSRFESPLIWQACLGRFWCRLVVRDGFPCWLPTSSSRPHAAGSSSGG